MKTLLPKGTRRYNSLTCREIPASLKVTAVSVETGETMAVESSEDMVFGIQFHPESFMSPEGIEIFRNFKEIVLES